MNQLQLQASDPNHSVWVSASAGTGKTKILTDRVLRLLLQKVPFNKILCLTFTNAGAAEMTQRLNTNLQKWASSSEYELQKDLSAVLGRSPTITEIKAARELYNQILSTHDKINIHTIHSFCQKILKRFPLESDLNPAFKIIDELQRKEILAEAKDILYQNASEDEIVKFFVSNCHELVIDEILTAIVHLRPKFSDALQKEQSFNFSEPILIDLGKIAQHPYVVAKIGQNANLSAIKDLFLTKEGAKRARLLSNKLQKESSKLYDDLSQMQNDFYDFDQAAKLKNIQQASSKLLALADKFIDIYRKIKRQKSSIDYDDLIYYTKVLLTEESAREWVLYKLEGGIEHLLIDEAQDTSIDQWHIIEALIEEFYAGESSNTNNRTIFVVGDEKQSIFSFQGADLNNFKEVNTYLQTKLSAAQKTFKLISLEHSYRSSSEILDIVHRVFEHIKQSNPKLFASDNPKIIPFRRTHPGTVELWDLFRENIHHEIFWPNADEHHISTEPSTRLAIEIAEFIEKCLKSATILPSTGKRARPRDFMILVRKRDKFTQEVIEQLKAKKLDVAGIDRLLLNNNLAVLDLLSAAKFALSPYDDLNLASLLKSPLINLGENKLFLLASSRGDSPLWRIIIDSEDESIMLIKLKLEQFLSIYAQIDGNNFFHILADCLDYRSYLIEAGGSENDDAINEFISISYSYFKNNNCLQSFIYWFEQNDIEIKRDVDATDKIRVMTTHGAKGLQAPVVILADTTTPPRSQNQFHWHGDQVFANFTGSMPDIFKEIQSKVKDNELQEYLRLLYVAMTRAQDHLVIAGYLETQKLNEHSWYSYVTGAMKSLVQPQINSQINNQINSNKIIYQSAEKIIPMIAANDDINHQTLVEIIEYDFDLHKHEIAKPSNAKLVPKHLEINTSLEYGKIFHKIIEDSLKYGDLAKATKHPLIKSLPIILQKKMRRSLRYLLNNDSFMQMLKHELKVEVNIGYDRRGMIKLGRLDLMIITKTDIYIIDYKTDAKPALNIAQVPLNYIKQLKYYCEAIALIYPQHRINGQILWLSNGKLISVYATGCRQEYPQE